MLGLGPLLFRRRSLGQDVVTFALVRSALDQPVERDTAEYEDGDDGDDGELRVGGAGLGRLWSLVVAGDGGPFLRSSSGSVAELAVSSA